MSRLLEQERVRVQQESTFRRSKCVELTEKLKSYVDEQKNVNGYIKDRWFRDAEIYPSDCSEYETFVSGINCDRENPIVIRTDGKEVDSIATHFDLDNNRVTFRVYRNDFVMW